MGNYVFRLTYFKRAQVVLGGISLEYASLPAIPPQSSAEGKTRGKESFIILNGFGNAVLGARRKIKELINANDVLIIPQRTQYVIQNLSGSGPLEYLHLKAR